MRQPTKKIDVVPIILALIFCYFAFPLSTRASSQCHDLDYHEGKVWEDSESSIFMAISIRLSDFAPAKLVCLAETLKHRYSDRKNITVLIFSSRDAAQRYLPQSADFVPAKNPKQQKLQNPTFWRSQLHGYYSYDAGKRQEYLDIRPFGSDVDEGPYDTRIDLPLTQTTSCRLELSGRCLLALERVSYPDAALTEKVSGDVTLDASISRSGKVSRVKVSKVRVEPPEQKEIIMNEAVQALCSWRFEPASRQDEFRITFSYIIDPSLPIPSPYRRQVDAKLALPNQVTIRGRSLE